MRRVAAESFLISAQGHQLVELSDAASNNNKLTRLLRLTRRAFQAGDALEQQVALIELLIAIGHIKPLLVGLRHHPSSIST